MIDQKTIEAIALASGFTRTPQGTLVYQFGDSGYLPLDGFFINLIKNATTVERAKHTYQEPEMTLRQYYAAKVLGNSHPKGSPAELAKWAFEVADAMIKFEQDEQS